MAPNPLPAPQQIDLTPLELMMQAAANATGSAHPEITAVAAQTASTPQDAATNAQAMGQYANATAAAEQLKGESIANQQQAWDSYSPQFQAQLHAAGYRKPGKPGFFGDVLHTLEGHPMSALKAVGQGFSDTVGKVVGSRPVGDVLNAVGSPLRAVQHGIRTLQDLADTAQRAEGDTSMASVTKGNNFGQGMAEWGHFFSELVSPHDWAHAWQETTKGQSYILPEVQREVINKYGQSTYQLALREATGTSQTQILQSALKQDPSGQLASQMASVMNGKDYKTAVQLLNAGHLSVGRMAVGPDFIARHPGVGNTVSGGIDGTVDWFGDPTIIGGKATKALKAGKSIVNSAEDVNNLYERSAAFRRRMTDIANIVASKDNVTQKLLDRHQFLGSAAEELQQANADTPDKVRQYFAARMAEKSVLEGQGGNSLKSSEFFGKPLPTLSRVGQLRLAAKGGLLKTINHAADKPYTLSGLDPADMIQNPLTAQGVSKITVGAGRLARRALTLVPQDRHFDLMEPNALNNVRDIAKTFLPDTRVGKILDGFANEPDPNGRWKIYRSLMIELGKTAGLDRNPDAWKSYMGTFASRDGRIYAPNNEDIVRVNGEDIHAGWLLAHQTTGVLVPNFRDMYTMGRKVGMSQVAGRAVNAEVLNRMMEQWRPLTLARPAFAGRAGGEEAARFVLSEGVGKYLKAQAAKLSYNAGMRAKAAQAAIDNPEMSLADAEKPLGVKPMASSSGEVQNLNDAHFYNRLAGHLPLATQNRIHSVADLVREYTVDQVKRALDKTGQALAPKDYDEWMRQVIKNGELSEGGWLHEHLGAMHGYDTAKTANGVSWMDPEELADPGRGKNVPVEMMRNGKWKQIGKGDPRYMHNLYANLSQLASDDWGREALLWRRSYNDRLQSVADALQNHPLWKSHTILSKGSPDGGLVATGEITERQAAEAHAARIIRNADRLTKHFDEASGKYKPIWLTEEGGQKVSLADFLLKNGKAPTLPALGEVPDSHLPTWAIGPDVAPTVRNPGLVHKYSDWMFRKIIGPQMNAISRTPLSIHNGAEAWKELEPWANMLKKAGIDSEHVDNLRYEAARQRAFDKTIPYVHNPNLRSQLSMVTRNVAPFWFAQEQFYKRWGRTLVESPEALRKAQLLSQGIRHAGFIHTDPESGQAYFVYPGSALTQSVIASTLSHFGITATAPVSAGLIGQVNMLNPGLERLGGPSFGPMVVIPINELKHLDPHMTNAVNAIEGKQAASSSFLQALLPTTILRALEAADPEALAPGQYHSAQMSAMMAMEATGHGIGIPAQREVTGPSVPNPQPGDYYQPSGQGGPVMVYQPDGTWRDNSNDQTYLDRLKKFSRGIFINRLLWGMSVPASPQVQFNPDNYSTEFKQLVNALGPSQATVAFLAQHPDSGFETMFQSQTNAGGNLPATKAAQAFLDANPALMKDYSLAAPYFIPAPDTAGKFDLSVYQEQKTEGFRQQKDPKSFYENGIYEQASTVYYAQDDARNKMLASNPGMRRQIDAAWTQWSEKFMAANPIFAKLYSDTGGIKRQQIMDQVGAVIRAGKAPDTAQTGALATLYRNWAAWKTMTGNFGNPNTPTMGAAQVNTINERFATWLSSFVQQNPGVKPLVDRTIRPDLSHAVNTMAANGVAVTF